MLKETSKSAFLLTAVLFFVFGLIIFATDARAAGDTAKGKKIFMSNCATCHGDKGDGKGAAAAALTPKPRNFTDAKEMKDIDDARMRKSIMEGRPGTGMVGWKSSLKPADIDDVMAYLRTLLKK